MELLAELEKKVLDVIQSNKNLKNRVSALEKENVGLKEQNKQLETSLLKKSDSLSEEKIMVKNTIQELLDGISSLETMK